MVLDAFLFSFIFEDLILTSVTAIIIICSTVGIIIALSLGIIITGVVRARRHPRRPGPPQLGVRPRRNRARGIVRAMLDTIPIVKFDDTNDGVDITKRDVEMSLASENPARNHSPPRSESIAAVGQPNPHESGTYITDQPTDRPTPTVPELRTDAVPDGGNLSCPICTNDFVKSQELRVLPCNHQFHPRCIDPWLVNVSGTCPLCRIDLNHPQSEDNAGQDRENAEHTENSSDGTAIPIADAMQDRHSQHGMRKYLRRPLNAWRMYNVIVEERLAALRRVREANEGYAAGDEAGEPLSRNLLTTQLRERFKIRTRIHMAGGSNLGWGITPMPSVLAPVHMTVPSASESNT
ncbi:Zinc finger RING-type [Penicillium lagena]|uniref:Zinc finger RING-type n=1 Tax=Penicillium lagena TaxID=94218 RepID=UPI0025410F8B|nr:Zinc finger RING-type [Penicillium lagena]KAJ5626317.1 Zinc finger RING-type [Penicillium lagena]